ncbi:hypothetical protein ACIQVO_07580 [Streptomyces sp. NPDC101062]|nr:hypothetical protein [Streptomyces sp. JV176]MEE1799244.1 hypothetical protein [Streptomyces sp. JV176]
MAHGAVGSMAPVRLHESGGFTTYTRTHTFVGGYEHPDGVTT